MSSRFRMAEGFAPGEFLKDFLQDRNWSQADFAEITGISAPRINSVIKGKASITVQMARALGEALETSAKYWLNLQSQYDLWITEEAAGNDQNNAISRKRELYTFPIKEMARRYWIEETKNLDFLERQVVDFFGVSCASDIPDLRPAARRAHSDTSMTVHQIAWLFRARQFARTLSVPAYSPKKLKESLDTLKALRILAEATREVPAILSSCGVRFVVIEGLSGLKPDGVCFWLEEEHPVIAISLRHDRIDNFWFTLRHEIEHVLRGDGKEVRLQDVEVDFEESTFASNTDGEQERREQIANEAAASFCVDRDELEDCVNRFSPYFSRSKIVAMAWRIGVHPGLVVGQLHKHTNGLPQSHMRKLLVGVRKHVLETSFKDGWDTVPQL